MKQTKLGKHKASKQSRTSKVGKGQNMTQLNLHLLSKIILINVHRTILKQIDYIVNHFGHVQKRGRKETK